MAGRSCVDEQFRYQISLCSIPCQATTESGHQASFETLPLKVASSVRLTDGSSLLRVIPELQLYRMRIQIVLFSQIGRIVFPHIVVE